MKPISIAATMTATLKPARMYSPSISKKLWPSCRLDICKFSSSLSTRYGLISDSTIKVLNMFNTSAATTYFGCSMVMYAPTIDIDTVDIAVADMVYMRLRDILPRISLYAIKFSD